MAQSVDQVDMVCSYDGLLDSDGDFIPDVKEASSDADSDGIPNYLDIDSDNDGLPDSLEMGRSWEVRDLDGDGVPFGLDHRDSDATNLCIDPGWEWPLLDMNGNGNPDYLEPAPALYTAATDPCTVHGGYTDTDRDFIADVIEGDDDTDNDGTPNYLDNDSDGDGLTDLLERLYFIEVYNRQDWDQDGIPEDIDIDDNNRDIACLVSMRPPADRDTNGIHDYLEPAQYFGGDNDPCIAHGGRTDSDGDGIADFLETEADSDGDGVPNYLDLDSDNDGLEDAGEYEASKKSNGRFYDYLNQPGGDRDGDGIYYHNDVDDYNHKIACIKDPAPVADFNKDGIADYLDPDSDDDGLLDSAEVDYKGMFTIDADNDTLSDVYELQLGLNPGAADTDGGGANDDWELFNGSNANDATDDASLPIDIDVDNDGIANRLEKNTTINRDSDGDGRSDAQEAGLVDLDNDGLVDDQTDANRNGQPDVGEHLTVLPDFDKDTVADMHDVDSDQDGIADRIEFQYFNLPRGYVEDANDVDGDGALNMHDLDSDNDGIFDINEDGGVYYVYSSPVELSFTIEDRDNDGIVDQLRDKDKNGIPDEFESSFQPGEPDADGDGIIDKADVDHAKVYNYGYQDYEGELQYIDATDKDGDGIADHVDHDDDNDGGIDGLRSDNSEFVDADADGIPALLDSDDVNAYQVTVAPAVGQENSSGGSSGGGGAFGSWWLLLGAFSGALFKRKATQLAQRTASTNL